MKYIEKPYNLNRIKRVSYKMHCCYMHNTLTHCSYFWHKGGEIFTYYVGGTTSYVFFFITPTSYVFYPWWIHYISDYYNSSWIHYISKFFQWYLLFLLLKKCQLTCLLFKNVFRSRCTFKSSLTYLHLNPT